MKTIKINELKCGQRFIYNNREYIKLNRGNLCIMAKPELWVQFDPINNDYTNSTIRQFINSNKFLNFLGLGVNCLDIEVATKYHPVVGDYLFLLSEEEFKKYKECFVTLPCSWWLRSPYADSASGAWFVNNDGYVDVSFVDFDYGVRASFILKSDTEVSIEEV